MVRPWYNYFISHTFIWFFSPPGFSNNPVGWLPLWNWCFRNSGLLLVSMFGSKKESTLSFIYCFQVRKWLVGWRKHWLTLKDAQVCLSGYYPKFIFNLIQKNGVQEFYCSFQFFPMYALPAQVTDSNADCFSAMIYHSCCIYHKAFYQHAGAQVKHCT